MTEIISCNENREFGLTVNTKHCDIKPAKSVEDVEAILTEHVLDCRHCLAMALFREECLSEVGCEEYKGLLGRMRAVCRTHPSLALGAQINDETQEAYFTTFDIQ